MMSLQHNKHSHIASKARKPPFMVIFLDWGGVFTSPRKFTSSTRWLEASLGIPEGTLSKRLYDNEHWTKAQIGEISDEEFWRIILKQFDILDDGGVAEFKGKLFSGEKDRLRPGMINLVKQLKRQYIVALLSNADNIFRPLLENKFHVDRLFNHVIISAEVGVAKPDPEIFRKACQIVDAQPGECIFVDDSFTNIQGAESIGIHSIHFDNSPNKKTLQLKKDLREIGISI